MKGLGNHGGRFEEIGWRPARAALMKAVRIHNYGGPEVLRYEKAPRPPLKKGEVLIAVCAAGVNSLDWETRAGALSEFIPHKLPLIPGWALSGVVEEVGPAVSRIQKGDEVFAVADPARDGAYADYIALPATAVALKPASLYHPHAAAIALPALAAWQSLFDLGQLRSGQSVLIHEGSGGVAHLAVQLARWRGAFVIATTSKDDAELLRSLGATQIIDETKRRFETVAHGLDLVLDTAGGATQERSWPVLKRGGILVSLVDPPSQKKAQELGVEAILARVEPNGAQLSRIANLIVSGKLKPLLDRILPLSEARRAHELSEAGAVHGQIVLRVKEPRS